VNVCTLEDPIEMVDRIHRCKSRRTGPDFAKNCALMRRDPDIIMVGEIRGTSMLRTGIGLRNDAPSAITRLLDLGVPSYLLNATLLGIMAQRLVRTLCPHCKQPTPMREDDIELWNGLVAPWKAPRPTQLQRPQGCLECRMTGYSGRIGIYEILLMSPELRKLITAETDIAALREQANREGMKPLRISGALKVAAGLTTLDEVLKTSPPADKV
jgi:general secretion pathway protein E